MAERTDSNTIDLIWTVNRRGFLVWRDSDSWSAALVADLLSGEDEGRVTEADVVTLFALVDAGRLAMQPEFDDGDSGGPANPRGGQPVTDKIHVHHADDGWRWTRKSENGKVTGASTESYSEFRGAVENIESTQGGEYEVVYDDA